jgi:UDP-N-acetylglucosamine:LPS N-acetylglucosamine transferase
MGEGHVGASREIARRVVERGHEARVVDFLDAFPAGLGKLWRGFYLLQLRRFPESYDSTYQLFYRHASLWRPFVSFEAFLAHRVMERWIADFQPDVVVSTYSFATLVLGELKAKGKLDATTVNFLTDFAVHPRSVHPAVDLNLAIHARPAAAAAARTGKPARALGPVVTPAFTSHLPERRAAREAWGIAPGERMVLVTVGSWGVGGGLEETVAIAAQGGWRVFTVCGTDSDLKARLEGRGLGTALGWTDRMPELIAAADVVLENAGGLTSLEAFAAGVPIVTYRPIPGHGRDNAREMAAAGVTWLANDEAELLRALDVLSSDSAERARQLTVTGAMFAGDPVDEILSPNLWDDKALEGTSTHA